MAEAHFEKQAVRCWRRDVFRALQHEGFTPSQIAAATVLAAVAAVGTGLETLQELTGLSSSYLTTVLRRLRQQRVLSGQRLRVAWNAKDPSTSRVGAVLDLGVAAKMFSRFPNEKRSAAQKARKPETRARGPRGKKTVVEPDAVCPPMQSRSNPLYGLPEWER